MLSNARDALLAAWEGVILPFASFLWSNGATIANLVAAAAAVWAVLVAIRVHREDSSPEVIMFLEADRRTNSVEVVTRNIGRSVAYDIGISGFEKSMATPKFWEVSGKSFVTSGIPMLEPGGERRTAITTLSEASNNLADESCVVTVTWHTRREEHGRNPMEASYVLEYGSFLSTLHTNSFETAVAREMSRSAKAQETLARETVLFRKRMDAAIEVALKDGTGVEAQFDITEEGGLPEGDSSRDSSE